MLQVVDDYDCMLNQTNIGDNNNKFYVIQVIEYAGGYYLWNRWGRVVSHVIFIRYYVLKFNYLSVVNCEMFSHAIFHPHVVS